MMIAVGRPQVERLHRQLGERREQEDHDFEPYLPGWLDGEVVDNGKPSRAERATETERETVCVLRVRTPL